MDYYKDIFPERPYLEDMKVEDLASSDLPAYIIDTRALERNMQILDSVQKASGGKILLALKGYATFSTFPILKKYLHGCCASSPWEARLARQEFGKEVHSYAPAFSESDFKEICELSDHVVFNSFQQMNKYKLRLDDLGIEYGLRVNPEHSETEVELYNPCSSASRLGMRQADFAGQDLAGLSGLHLHTLCQQGSEALLRTAKVFEAKFKAILPSLKWLNFGGGHHITQAGYNIDLLIEIIEHFQETYDLQVYLEPGEAIAINTGSLVCSVLEVFDSGDHKHAILDISATCHMPDVLEMPYRPELRGSAEAKLKEFTYRLGGLSCLAGDVIGDYSFDRELKPGDRLIFDDMSHYTMVKTSYFNGIQHPSIAHFNDEGLAVVRRFSYSDYKTKLG